MPFEIKKIVFTRTIYAVDAFQGSEKEIIFLSTSRTSARSLGFLASPQRLNVSITRARRHVILVGMARVLKASPLWRAVIGSCTLVTSQAFLSQRESWSIQGYLLQESKCMRHVTKYWENYCSKLNRAFLFFNLFRFNSNNIIVNFIHVLQGRKVH